MLATTGSAVIALGGSECRQVLLTGLTQDPAIFRTLVYGVCVLCTVSASQLSFHRRKCDVIMQVMWMVVSYM